MPSELRHLLFKPAEVVQAVKEYYRRTGQRLPAGSIVRCTPESEAPVGPVRFRITIIPDSVDAKGADPAAEDVVIEGSVLAAALILHCRDRRIPLPASADKSLQLFGNQLCLLVTINPKQDELPKVTDLHL